MSNQLHRHCCNHAPIDVVKGICLRSKDNVAADDSACAEFEARPRCGLCQHFTPADKAFLGTCQAAPTAVMTYPDLSAVTCEQFAWKQG